MKEIKSILFKTLENNLSFFGRIGLTKKTPGVLKIYNFFYNLFWPYKNVIEIQGSKMWVGIKQEPLSMRRTFELYASNLIHEKATTDLFKKVVKEGNVVVDLGANVGYFTLLAARLVGEKGKVYAFEPEPKNYSYLVKNIKLNNYNNVQAFQKAVSDKNGKTQLYICDYDSGHHTINQYGGVEKYSRGRLVEEKSIEIEAVTLDEFFKNREESIDVIKMDVEGAEALALAGMDNILRKNKKLKMFVEFFPLLIRKMGNSPEEFIYKLLKDYQFSIYVIPEDYDAQKGEMIRINSAEEIMNSCKGEESHINLFLEKDGNNKINS
ncbi:MAG: hypothetical protein C0412_19845 [Flavobacterium sp.]|nr:hypothetical protein [Flavobacterium sp.]